MTPFWQSLAQPYNQQQSPQQQQEPQQENYHQPGVYNEDANNNNQVNETNTGQYGAAYPGNTGSGELKTLNDFDLFNSFPLEEMLGIASMNLP